MNAAEWDDQRERLASLLLVAFARGGLVYRERVTHSKGCPRAHLILDSVRRGAVASARLWCGLSACKVHKERAK